MCEYGKTITKGLPDFVQAVERRIHSTVEIDSCLVDVVDALWLAGVVTRSVCCGHGESGASILVHQQDAMAAAAICAGRATVSYWKQDGTGMEVQRP